MSAQIVSIAGHRFAGYARRCTVGSEVVGNCFGSKTLPLSIKDNLFARPEGYWPKIVKMLDP